MAAPMIGLSANRMGEDPSRRFYPNKRLAYAETSMAAAVARAGGIPVVLPDLLPGAVDLDGLLERLDGLLLTGGEDVAPETYGAHPILGGRFPGDPHRDRVELELVRRAADRNLPILGICRGHQVLNVALGGTLLQDIETQRPKSTVRHRDPERYDRLGHPVRVAPDSRVAELLSADAGRAYVNSVHHQAVDRVAFGLRPTAWAEDGIVEAVESVRGDRFLLGVQWHPEWMPWNGSPEGPWAAGGPFFTALVEAAAARISGGETPCRTR